MQGLADGYFVLPVTVGDYLATQLGKKVSADRPEFKQTQADVEQRISRLVNAKGNRTVAVSEENRKTGKLVAMAMVKSVRQLASTLVVAA